MNFVNKFLVVIIIGYINTVIVDARSMMTEEVYIESPIEAKLEIDNLKATVKLVNISESPVYIDENTLGINGLSNQIFYLNPWYAQPNLTFYNNFNKHKVTYIEMKPSEEIRIVVDLEKYYNFNEKEYQVLTVTYLLKVILFDANYKPVLKRNYYDDNVQVKYRIKSNDIDLNYIEDILPYLRNENEYQ